MGWLLAAGDRVACNRGDVEQWQDFPPGPGWWPAPACAGVLVTAD